MKALLLLALVSVFAAAQNAPADSRKIRITLERLDHGKWTPVDPGLVFAQGDRVRFQIRADFEGYLYVVDYGTSGKYSVLFPSQDAGSDNRLHKAQSLQIPTANADFRIAGPPGQDIVYWTLSPVPLGADTSIPVPEKPKNPPLLMPRCDDSLLRARGECIDQSAGVRDLDVPPPDEVKPAGDPADLTFLREEKSSVVAANGSHGPMVYEFRISHK